MSHIVVVVSGLKRSRLLPTDVFQNAFEQTLIRIGFTQGDADASNAHRNAAADLQQLRTNGAGLSLPLEFGRRETCGLTRNSPKDRAWEFMFGDVVPIFYPRIVRFIGPQGLVAVVADNGRLWAARNYLTLVHEMMFWSDLCCYPLENDSGFARARELARHEFQEALESQPR